MLWRQPRRLRFVTDGVDLRFGRFYTLIIRDVRTSMKGTGSMDKVDEKLLDLLKANARMSFQELGDHLGMSRVAAKKRVEKLEKAGIIRGYNTTIYMPNEVTIFIDLETVPGDFEEVLEYVSTRTAYIRQIFCTTKENHIHIVAASTDTRDLKYLITMIQKKCGDKLEKISSHAVTDIVKDVYGGVRYDKSKRKLQSNEGDL